MTPTHSTPLDAALKLASVAADALAERSGVPQHDLAVVLGSGWSAAGDLLGRTTASIPATDLPGFRSPSVEGHRPTLASIETKAGIRVLVLGARHHFYESRDVAAVAHPVRVAAAAGCRAVVLTNGCGSIRPDLPPGTVVLIRDHLNLTGATPLLGPVFVDLTDLYSSRIRALARDLDPDLPEGVYAQFPGPQYETPAEVRMAHSLGADLVGMSTALEAIAARAAGLEVAGLSLVTNLATGVSGQALSHEEVLAAGHAAGARPARLLADLVDRI